MKIGFKETDSMMYRFYTMLFYSFIVMMLVMAGCKFLGITSFVQQYISLEVTATQYMIGAFLLKTFECTFIMLILTNFSRAKCFSLAAIYVLFAGFISNSLVLFLTEISYTVSIPFLVNKNKETSILNSSKYFVFICIYQFIMMFGRNYPATSKHDLVWLLLAGVDYYLFIVTIYLYKIRRGLC